MIPFSEILPRLYLGGYVLTTVCFGRLTRIQKSVGANKDRSLAIIAQGGFTHLVRVGHYEPVEVFNLFA